MNLKRTVFYKMIGQYKKSFQRMSDAFDPATHTVEKDIEQYKAFRAELEFGQKVTSLMRKPPKDVSQESVLKAGVKTIIATPSVFENKYVLYVHGGAWTLGLMDVHQDFAARLAKFANAIVWSPHYRLAPEHPFPAALEDVFGVYTAMLQQGIEPKKIVLIGDSAGGNLLLSLMLKLKQENLPLPGAAIPLSAVTDLNWTGESHKSRADIDPLLPSTAGDLLCFSYLRGTSPNNPLVSPLLGDLKGLPPLLILVGGREILYSDSINFAEKAKKAGVDVTLDIEENMIHAYPLFSDFLEEAEVAMNKIVSFINEKIKE